MRIRIVVADQSEARFFDVSGYRRPLVPAGNLLNPAARLHTRDLDGDRPGRTLARGLRGHRGGASHDYAPANTTRRRASQLFARRIATELDVARRAGRFERLVVVAAPAFLGELRAALSAGCLACLASTVNKDVVHQGARDPRAWLGREIFLARSA